MYRFLLSAGWLALSVAMLALAAVMVMLGLWQLDRYHERTAINDRIDAATAGAAVPLREVLDRPAGAPGTPPVAVGAGAAWRRVTVTGRYDPVHEILVRGRVLDGRVGFEVVTPLVLPDGSAVLVDRGWLPAVNGPATARPDIPPAPPGDVSVTGPLHLAESRPGPLERRDGRVEVRRVNVGQLAPTVPYPLFGAYVMLDEQDPPASAGLTAVPPRRENAWQNAGYVVQWWMFALLTIGGLGWLIRREARTALDRDGRDRTGEPRQPVTA